MNSKLEIESEIDKEQTWPLIESYFEQNKLVRQQLESYDEFVNVMIQDIVDNSPPIEIEWKNEDYGDRKQRFHLTFRKVSIGKPQNSEKDGTINYLYPDEARIRNLVYSSPLYCFVNYRHEIFENNEWILDPDLGEYAEIVNQRELLGYIPVMVRSSICSLNGKSDEELMSLNECPYDQGGYFIVNGSEKVLIAQERQANNKVFCFKKTNGSHTTWTSEIRSSIYCGVRPPISFKVEFNNKGEIVAHFHNFKDPIPIAIVFRALGCQDEESIMFDFIGIDEEDYEMIDAVQSSFDAGLGIDEIAVAQDWIGKRPMKNENKNNNDIPRHDRIEMVKMIFEKELFPHLGESFIKKSYYLGYMVKRLLNCVLEREGEDDRDHMSNKRLDMAGILLGSLFRMLFRRFRTDIKNFLQKRVEEKKDIHVSSAFKSKVITSDLKSGIATGNWGLRGSTNIRTGVSQVLNRLTYMASLSHLRRINAPGAREGKQTEPRQLHSSQWAYICPAETPEGQSVGLVKNRSLAASISVGTSKENIVDLILGLGVQTIDEIDDKIQTLPKIMVNGDWLGYHNDIDWFRKKLLKMRREVSIDPEVSFYWNSKANEFHIDTSAGRAIRPLLIVEDGKLKLKCHHLEMIEKGELDWTRCVAEGIVEYLDSSEEENSFIAFDPDDLLGKNMYGPEVAKKYTHMELHSSLILGICASIIPFSDHNQSPRNTYQCLHPDTLVTLADNTKKMIKDVKVGDMVVTYDHETLSESYSPVINQYVRKSIKDIYTVRTISGREIIATEDHKLFTDRGFVEVGNFDENTLLGVSFRTNTEFDNSRVKILESSDFEKVAKQYYSDRYVKIVTEDAKEWFEEIPVNKIATLAGIVGFLMTDGSLCESYSKRDKKTSLNVNFCHGNLESATQLQNDLELLGFGRKKVHKQVRTHSDGEDGHEVTLSGFTYQYQGKLAILMKSLGVSVGRQTVQAACIPDFIRNGKREIKRAFLAGLFGGNGGKIRYAKRKSGTYDYQIGCLYQSKTPKYLDSLKSVFNEVSKMMKLFGVETSYINETKTKKYGKVKLYLGPSQTQANIIKFFEEIGFRYDTYKSQFGGVIVEYLKYKQCVNKGRTRVRHGFKDYMTIEDFISRTKVVENSNMMFVPIESVNPYTDSFMISDITVADTTRHDFIANGILSRNSAMGKQAMGIYASNFQQRMDTLAHTLWYPQKPLACTRGMDHMSYRELPAGVNAIVAVAPWGYNQEDSLIMNQSSVDRGLFRSTFTRCYQDTEREAETGNNETFEKPTRERTKRMKTGNYEKLDSDGFVPPGIRVNEDDAVIGKTTPSGETRMDNSTKMRKNENGVVDRVVLTTDQDGKTFTKVRVRSMRVPEQGDKFASRHGQKGTIGLLVRQEDMPFSSDGIVPDIIINPHALPSRMTIGHLIEAACSKLACMAGIEIDATPFNGFDPNHIQDALQAVGFQKEGYEMMYDGKTGKMLKMPIFLAPTYYQRLKHMVADKQHARSSGPVTMLTRQPMEGRAKDGGLRFGEMERDALISHGSSYFMRDRLFRSSDYYEVDTCLDCGLFVSVNLRETPVCRNCSSKNIKKVEIPYASKLLFQELISMGIVPRIECK